MIESLIPLVVQLVILALFFWLVWWALSQIPLPEPFNTVIRVVMVLIVFLVVASMLLGIFPSGHRLLR